MTAKDEFFSIDEPTVTSIAEAQERTSNAQQQFTSFPRAVSTENSPINGNVFDKDSQLANSKNLRNIIIVGFIFSLSITFALILQIAFGPDQVPSRIGIVTPEPICSEIGSQMVRKGGNSADAFIASSLCLAVVNPFSAGFGAGGFLALRDHKRNKNYAVNCFFKSGNFLDPETYKVKPESKKYSSIAIPGELKCLQYVYHKYSRFYWKTLAAPAIILARNGFKVSSLLDQKLQELNDINKVPAIFMINNSVAKTNDIVRNELLAKTLETLDRNDNALYDGNPLTRMTIDDSQGQFSEKDLKTYSAINNDQVLANYKDFNLLTASYPSNGPILKFILKMMEQVNAKEEDFKSAEYYHRLLEAIKIAYIGQSNIADPYQTKVMNYLTDNFLNLTSRFLALTEFNKSVSLEDILLSNYTQDDDLTANYISVNDHNDLMISYVGTLGSSWGSGVFTRNGFFLNDGLTLFSYGEKNMNNFAFDKQPRGLFAPIITYNSKNPCMRRFVISYSHDDVHDFCLSALSQIVLKLFTSLSFYPSAVSDKRVEYTDNGLCFEGHSTSSMCHFEPVNLVMKKDPIISCQVDNDRNTLMKNNFVVFNE